MGRRPFYSAALTAIILTAASSTIATADNQPAGHLTISPTASAPAPPKVEPHHLSISPRSARPGQLVTLDLYAYCHWASGEPSPVVTIGQFRVTSPYDYGEFQASATVNADAKPGRYEVSASCYHGLPPQEDTYKAQLTITNAKAPAPKPRPAAHQVKQVPKGAAQTGGGGTASQG